MAFYALIDLVGSVNYLIGIWFMFDCWVWGFMFGYFNLFISKNKYTDLDKTNLFLLIGGS